jgi:hypothetical protein
LFHFGGEEYRNGNYVMGMLSILLLKMVKSSMWWLALPCCNAAQPQRQQEKATTFSFLQLKSPNHSTSYIFHHFTGAIAFTWDPVPALQEPLQLENLLEHDEISPIAGLRLPVTYKTLLSLKMRSLQRKLGSIFVFLAFLITAVTCTSQEEENLVGWQPNPARRGALSILESCLFTIVACTWSIQHLNVPAPSDSESTKLRRRIKHALMTVLMPEVVLAHAIVERTAAIQSLKDLREADIEDLEVCYIPWSWRRVVEWFGGLQWKVLGCCSCRASGTEGVPAHDGVGMDTSRVKWTLAHAYFANMGGLRLESRVSDSIVNTGLYPSQSIPITTRQFSNLRSTGVIQATPAVAEEEINDKSKTDYFTKGLAVVQISQLILSLIGRTARHLAISQVEIITVSFAACAIAIYCFAWNKPQNINTTTTLPIFVLLDSQTTHMVLELQPKELFNLLAGKSSFELIRFTPMLKRIRNGNIELSTRNLQPISLWLTASVVLFGAIHLSAWNFTFPSPTERNLWRIGSTIITILPVFLLPNSTIAGAMSKIHEEVHTFENSIFSLWRENHLAAGLVHWARPVPYSTFRPNLFEFVDHMALLHNSDGQLKPFRAYIKKQETSPGSHIRVENFEWLLNEFVLPRFEPHVDHDDLNDGLQTDRLIIRLRERTGNALSLLERTALAWEASDRGPYIFLVLGSIYSLFRLLIIVLSFTSLRAMPNSVYDTTWAKNIPSVQ